ncbi:hypothetical protein BV22DRAFT_273567 [Leucogyrophana mollusca]|uniref:Uncharacterized protein n=1 Tax=Leucogyrophana mollusca TaxID=85980 RepID=A0ACB8BQ27_9AGAM|nr:hypothetical protein BV22DRAFT_273567 [Leucogyrophana mollusca]
MPTEASVLALYLSFRPCGAQTRRKSSLIRSGFASELYESRTGTRCISPTYHTFLTFVRAGLHNLTCGFFRHDKGCIILGKAPQDLVDRSHDNS